jgi:hypothetical protein
VSGELEIMSTDELVAKAFAEGCTVVGPFSGEDELRIILLDLDSEAHRAAYFAALPLVTEFIDISETEWWVSKSGTGWHYKLTLSSPLTSPLEAVALQALLGSDGKREAFALRRLRAGGPFLNTLFKPLTAEVHKA